jgi:hypothetical protein
MALPQTVRVKLSSEVAEAISITPVVVQELAVRELVEHLLGIAGKDERRIRELLLRGTLVSGASRFRWAGWDADIESLRELLATFPDADPARPFAAAGCIRATLRGGRHAIEVPRQAAARKSLFQRTTFWDALMEVVGASHPAYSGYSYRERADRYLRDFTREELARLRAAAPLLRYTILSDQLRTQPFTQAELLVTREA